MAKASGKKLFAARARVGLVPERATRAARGEDSLADYNRELCATRVSFYLHD